MVLLSLETRRTTDTHMHKSALYPIRPERSEYSSTNGICDVERQWNMLGACDEVDGPESGRPPLLKRGRVAIRTRRAAQRAHNHVSTTRMRQKARVFHAGSADAPRTPPPLKRGRKGTRERAEQSRDSKCDPTRCGYWDPHAVDIRGGFAGAMHRRVQRRRRWGSIRARHCVGRRGFLGR